MLEQELNTNIETTSITDWLDEATRHIDVVASWESLLATYDALRFSDELSDVDRLEEFKWIVQRMNSFLTKIRSKLLTCKNSEAMIQLLQKSLTPAGKMELSSREALAYQKLKQRWIISAIEKILTLEQEDQYGE